MLVNGINILLYVATFDIEFRDPHVFWIEVRHVKFNCKLFKSYCQEVCNAIICFWVSETLVNSNNVSRSTTPLPRGRSGMRSSSPTPVTSPNASLTLSPTGVQHHLKPFSPKPQRTQHNKDAMAQLS